MSEMIATPSKEWKNRMRLLAAFAFGFGLWFFYDGFIGYPKGNERAEAYKELKDRDRLADWPRLAAERGWVEKDPGAPKSEGEILTQKILGILCVAGSTGILLWYRNRSKRTLRADDAAIHPPGGGEPVPFDSIREIDMSKWAKKGIAIALYDKDGQPGKLVLDDWMFTGAEAIIREAERRIAARG